MKVEKPADDKKKVIIIAALGLLLVGVGAFQFLPGSSAPTPTTKPAKKVEPVQKAEDEGPKNPEVANALPERDPFEGPEPPDPAGKINANASKPPKRQPSALPGTIMPAKGPELPKPGETLIPTEAPPFGFSVAGTVVGEHSVAVFRDAQGRQRLVREGDALDADTQVVSIQKSEVTVVFRGKQLHLKTGGNAVAK